VTLADLPDWERLLAAERHLQALVPGSALVGGTAAALHAGHPRSLDGDHVLVADPPDRAGVDLATYKDLVAPWNDWAHLAKRGRYWARTLAQDHLSRGDR
jgi:hypothetical protein